jgi:GTP cyclohydrolase I
MPRSGKSGGAARLQCRAHGPVARVKRYKAMKVERLTELFGEVLDELGLDRSQDGLRDTPKRTAQALAYLTKGYRESLDEVVNGAVFDSDNDEMILVKDIELYSLCEHHILPFIGKCHVGYLPTGKVLGLSKIARIVDMYARRLQIQETLTKQIAEVIMDITRAKGVGVVIEARHLCMMMRGVEKQNSLMKTSMMLGTFRKDSRTRTEFLRLLKD